MAPVDRAGGALFLLLIVSTTAVDGMSQNVATYCVYGAWTEWGECTAPCAGGIHTRHRALDTTTTYAQFAQIAPGSNDTNPLAKCESAQSQLESCNARMCTGGECARTQ